MLKFLLRFYFSRYGSLSRFLGNFFEKKPKNFGLGDTKEHSRQTKALLRFPLKFFCLSGLFLFGNLKTNHTYTCEGKDRGFDEPRGVGSQRAFPTVPPWLALAEPYPRFNVLLHTLLAKGASMAASKRVVLSPEPSSSPNTVAQSTVRHSMVSLGAVLLSVFLFDRGVMVPEETAQQMSGWLLTEVAAGATVLGGLFGGAVRSFVNRR